MREFKHHRRLFRAGLPPQPLMRRMWKLLKSSRMQQSEIELQLNNSRPDPFASPLIEQPKPHSLLEDNPCSG
jgi:hypothetical protein